MTDYYTVKLPPLDWFLNGNDYSGSFRPDLTKGCLDQTTFNYRVKLVKEKEGLRIGAICFYMLPWNGERNMDEAFVGKFEASEFGLEVAAGWIRSKFIEWSPLQLDVPKMVQLPCYTVSGRTD